MYTSHCRSPENNRVHILKGTTTVLPLKNRSFYFVRQKNQDGIALLEFLLNFFFIRWQIYIFSSQEIHYTITNIQLEFCPSPIGMEFYYCKSVMRTFYRFMLTTKINNFLTLIIISNVSKTHLIINWTITCLFVNQCRNKLHAEKFKIGLWKLKNNDHKF